MGYISFHEYVDKNSKSPKKGDKSPKAKTAVVADYDGPMKDSPELAKMPPDAGGVGQSGKVTPYKGGKDAADPNKGKLVDGLAKKPGKEGMGELGKPEKVLGNYPSIKTSEWIDSHKGLSLSEFAKKVRENRLSGVENPSRAYESIKETFDVCKKNGSYVMDVVLEMRRAGLAGTFVSVLAQQPECINVIAHMMENDESFARKLSMALEEMVGPPVGGDEEMEDDCKEMGDEPVEGEAGESGEDDDEDAEVGDAEAEGEDELSDDGEGDEVEDAEMEVEVEPAEKPMSKAKDNLQKMLMKMMGHR